MSAVPGALDMSLDDVIMQTRTSSRHRNASTRGGRSTRGAVRGNRARITRARGRRSGVAGATTDLETNDRRGVNARTWRNDMFGGGRRTGRLVTDTVPQENVNRGSGILSSDAGAKLTISNLHHEVSNNDLSDLFEAYGPLRKVHIYYDRAGRSNGIADVVFESRRNAMAALERFDNIPLDGRPMKIEMSRPALPVITSRFSSEGSSLCRVEPRTARIQRSSGLRRGGRRIRQRGSRRGTPRSQAELDADMDAYMMNTA